MLILSLGELQIRPNAHSLNSYSIPSICYEMLNISYFDKFLLILFVGLKISFYFCISKNDKSLK